MNGHHLLASIAIVIVGIFTTFFVVESLFLNAALSKEFLLNPKKVQTKATVIGICMLVVTLVCSITMYIWLGSL